jgi:PAS domain S-box-containing protein
MGRASFDSLYAGFQERGRAKLEVIVPASLTALCKALPDAIVIANRHGEILLVNSQTEKLFGYRREELLATPLELLIPERLRSQYAAHWAAGENSELIGLRKDGAEFPAGIILSPSESQDGDRACVAVVIRDISATKATELRLRQMTDEMQRSRDSLARIAHDLRSPLASIYSFGTIIADGLAGDVSQEQNEYLQIILRNVQKLLTMIENGFEGAEAPHREAQAPSQE